MNSRVIREWAIWGVVVSGLFGCSAAEPTEAAEGVTESVASETSALPISIAAALDGVMLTAPCGPATGPDTCQTRVGQCPAANPNDPALSGALLTDKVVTLGGSAARNYTITLRIQGVVEAKRYKFSTDSNGTATSPAANGFSAGGAPDVSDAYGAYMIRTSNPPQSYFLNSLVPPGISNHTTYGVDYTATIVARGGSTIRLVASDPNCVQIKNCGTSANPSACMAPITLVPNARAVAANPGFNFNAAYNGQWLVMTVSRVD